MTLRDTIRRQLDLEDESRSLGVARYERSRPLPWRSPEDNPSVEEEANLPPGKHLIRLAIKPTAERIREWIADASSGKAGRRHSALGWMEMAEPEEVAYLAARVALNSSASQVSLQTAALSLGRAIIDHVEMVNFKQSNPAGYAGLMRQQHRITRGSQKRRTAIRKLLENESARVSIASRELLHLGMIALELLIEATGLFTEELVRKNKDRTYILRATEPVRKWLVDQHSRSALLSPILLPMIIRPKRWRSPSSGGYLRKLPGRGLVKSADPEYQARLRNADLTKVYEAVNHIQETPWRVNRKVLEVMRRVWDEGGLLGGLPAREDTPLPPIPPDMDVNEEAKANWKREAAAVHAANAALFSKRLSVQQQLWVAERFADEEAIWFPHSMDFRGRVYPIPTTGLQPQSDDPGKALLEFAHGKPVGPTGGYWLAVHIANLFGVDKVAFRDRVKWTYDHAAQLIDSAVDPLDGSRFWTTAEHPWMALAAAMDFAGFVAEGPAYVSRLPIPLDGSNSGLQHLSAMLKDPIGAAAVNLTPAAEPQDVYTRVAEAAQSVVEDSSDPDAAPWKGGKVNRKIAKRPTMTFAYSATRYGIQNMVLETLRELDAERTERGEAPYLEGADNYEAAKYLSHVLFQAIAEVVSAATQAMEWLKDVARVASRADVALTWTTPDGLPVTQANRVTVGSRLQVHWRGRRLDLTLLKDGSRIDGRRQTSAIAPNVVHSFDGAHLRAVARAAKAAGINSLGVIHDSFSTHATDTDRLVDILRETFADQYEPDVLSKLREEVIANLPPEWASSVPEPPNPGLLNLDQVRSSQYLFA
ncbi:DNA-directed RNA polymerase [Allosphingosinicella humi]